MQQLKMLTYRHQRQLANQSKRDSCWWWSLSRHPDHSTTIWNITRKEDEPTQHLVCMLRLMTSHTKNYGEVYHFHKELPKREGWNRQVLADVSEEEGMDWDFILANTRA